MYFTGDEDVETKIKALEIKSEKIKSDELKKEVTNLRNDKKKIEEKLKELEKKFTQKEHESESTGIFRPSELIVIKVVGQDLTLLLRLKMSTNMAKLKKSYADRLGVGLGDLRFLFDGEFIDDEETPKALEMEQDDVIEVHRRIN